MDATDKRRAYRWLSYRCQGKQRSDTRASWKAGLSSRRNAWTWDLGSSGRWQLFRDQFNCVRKSLFERRTLPADDSPTRGSFAQHSQVVPLAFHRVSRPFDNLQPCQCKQNAVLIYRHALTHEHHKTRKSLLIRADCRWASTSTS
jgi:hypothetical protein